MKIQIPWANFILFIPMLIVILTELQQVSEAGFLLTEDRLTLSQQTAFIDVFKDLIFIL